MSVMEKTVREIMETEVVNVRPDLPVKELIEVLEENQITGAPVVDDGGDVVGVVSTRDVLRLAAREEETGSSSGGGGQREDDESGYFRYANGPAGFLPALPPGLPKTRLGTRPVRDIMTRATFSVRPDATLAEAARFLHKTGIHRALVFEGNRLAGVVSLRDVVAAVAAAAES